jgi:hypothetical protein
VRARIICRIVVENAQRPPREIAICVLGLQALIRASAPGRP